MWFWMDPQLGLSHLNSSSVGRPPLLVTMPWNLAEINNSTAQDLQVSKYKSAGAHKMRKLNYEVCEVLAILSCLTHLMSSLHPHGLQPSHLFCPWNSPGKNTGVGSHSLLQGSSQSRDWTWVSCVADGFFTIWATREAPDYYATG